MHTDRKVNPSAFARQGVVDENKSQWSGMSTVLETAPSGIRAEMLRELAFYGGSLLLPTTPQVFPPTRLQEEGAHNKRNTQSRERSRRKQVVVRCTLYILAGIAAMVMLMAVFSSAAFAAVGTPPCNTLLCEDPSPCSPIPQDSHLQCALPGEVGEGGGPLIY